MCEVTLLTWPPSNMWSVAKKGRLERRRVHEALKECGCGGRGEEEETEAARTCGDALRPR